MIRAKMAWITNTLAQASCLQPRYPLTVSATEESAIKLICTMTGIDAG
jgi:hypothetical protein